MSDRTSSALSRRSFLRSFGISLAGLPLAERLLASPDAPPLFPALRRDAVRVRGAVRINGRGKGGVGVSDGMTVVRTAADGSFELRSDTSAPFVFLSLPAGVEIPVTSRGSQAFYRPLTPDAHGEMTVAWDLRPLEGGDEKHAFLLLADPQVLDMDDIRLFHSQTVPDIRALAAGMQGTPLFGVGCGDLMFDNLELFPEFEKGIQQTGIPFVQVLGNHDVDARAKTDEESTATFMRTFGPTFYSFNRGAVHYVVLDDVLWLGDGYIGYLTKHQLDWLASDLALVERGRPVIVFMHIPSYCTQHLRYDKKRPERSVVVANRDLLMQILEPYPSHIVVGHMHETEHLEQGNAHLHVCGAVCGAWWTGPICGDGTPNGYGVYEINGEDVRWRYKGTGLPAEEQMRIFPAGTDPAAPEECIVNIWDWDPHWHVVWYENGMRRGKVRQRRGQDPLSVRLHAGPDLPRKHTWVEPYMTDHLFRFTQPGSQADVVVEVTDRAGRTYTQKLHSGG